MSRLIDADELYERTLSIKNSFARRTMEYLISTQPTAFDKDKVIEELAEEILEYQLGGMPRNNYESGYEDGSEYGFNMAIDIVERGGIDD